MNKLWLDLTRGKPSVTENYIQQRESCNAFISYIRKVVKPNFKLYRTNGAEVSEFCINSKHLSAALVCT